MPLSKKQYGALGSAARRAFSFGVSTEEKNDIAFILHKQGKRVSETAVYNEWRRAELARALFVGSGMHEPPSSFSDLRQKDYAVAMEHFSAIAGDAEAAIHYRHQSIMHGRSVVLALIEASCKSRKLAFPQYPDSICRDQYGVATVSASEKQLWTILFTIRNRRRCSPKDEQKPTRRNFIPQPKFLN